MKFLIVLLLIGAAIAVNSKAVHHGDKAHKQHKAWAEHKAKHHPKFDSPEEENQLKARFAKTDEMIHKHNSDPNVKHHIGHNHFSTMTNEEKRVHMFGVKPQPLWQSASPDKLAKAWAQHKAKYHPEMDSPEEETVRKAQFAKAHKMIQEHNSDPEATHHLTHNHFSSMTNDEKKKLIFGVQPVDEPETAAESEAEHSAADGDEIMVKAPKPIAVLPIPWNAYVTMPTSTTRVPCTPDKYRNKGCGLQPCAGETWYCFNDRYGLHLMRTG